jgi:hypothetical protein
MEILVCSYEPFFDFFIMACLLFDLSLIDEENLTSCAETNWYDYETFK